MVRHAGLHRKMTMGIGVAAAAASVSGLARLT